MQARPSLVVRKYAPARRILLLAAIVLLVLLAAYIVYELGRYDAGYDRLAVGQQRTEYQVRIDGLEKTNRDLRTKLAELDTIRVGRSREQAEVARSIGDLQAQVAKLSQELAFYRGVVAQGSSDVGVKIGQVRISPEPKSGQFVVHLSLVRSGKADNIAAGTITLSVDGEAAGTNSTVAMPALTAGKLREVPFSFRYYQNFDQAIALPAGFKPEHLLVEVRSNRKDAAALAQTFLWSLEASP